MKFLNVSYFSIKRIISLDYEKNIPIDNVEDIFSILGKISPLKIKLWQRQNPRHISLVLKPDTPFGPDSDILKSILFEKQNYDFDSALADVINFFDIKRFDIFGNDTRNISMAKNRIVKENLSKRLVYKKQGEKPQKDTIILDLIQFYNLYRAVKDKVIDKMVVVSFFMDPDNSYSFIVKPGEKLISIISASERLNTVPLKLYHPMSGREINPLDEVASEKNSTFFIEQSIDEKARGKTLTPSPCINCLACVEYCPAGLHPSYLYHLIIRDNIDDAFNLAIETCILCGKCNFVCPSSLPLADKIEEILINTRETSDQSEIQGGN